MDNKISSQIKRGLKITTDYFITLIIFAIFLSIVLSISGDNYEKGIFIYSILIFLIMFSMIYNNMSDVAFREKRPQYGINPSPYKGFMYGFIGMLPILILQIPYYFIHLEENFATLQRRLLQGLTGPLYWLASLISEEPWAYHLVLLMIPLIAGLGYLAGHHGFYITRKLKLDKLFTRKNQDKKPPAK